MTRIAPPQRIGDEAEEAVVRPHKQSVVVHDDDRSPVRPYTRVHDSHVNRASGKLFKRGRYHISPLSNVLWLYRVCDVDDREARVQAEQHTLHLTHIAVLVSEISCECHDPRHKSS